MLAAEFIRPANRKDAAAVQLLLGSERLESEFVAAQFVVAEADGRIVGCARAKPLPEGGTELCSVAVRPEHRGRGLARGLVTTALLGARHPVYALTLVPDMARHAGFEDVPPTELPASLRTKASACDTAGRAWNAMRLRRAQLSAADEAPTEFLPGASSAELDRFE